MVDRGVNLLKNLIKSMFRFVQVVMDKCVICFDDQWDDFDYFIIFDFSIFFGLGDKEDLRIFEGLCFFVFFYMVQYECEGFFMYLLLQIFFQWEWNIMGR